MDYHEFFNSCKHSVQYLIVAGQILKCNEVIAKDNFASWHIVVTFWIFFNYLQDHYVCIQRNIVYRIFYILMDENQKKR